jgi:hypothetical protein
MTKDLGPYFCTAPWTHTYLNPQSERRICCASREQASWQKQYIDAAGAGNTQYAPFSLSFENSCKIWGIEHADHLPFLTPFFVKTNMMQDMVDELKNMLKGIFPFLFSIHLDGAPFVTKFLLYNAYCYSKNKLNNYADWRHNDRKFFSAVIQSLEHQNSDGSRKMNFGST